VTAAALAASCAAVAVLLSGPARPALRLTAADPASSVPAERPGGLRRHRLLLTLLAGLGGWLFVGGPAAPAAGGLAAAAAWTVIGRTEDPVARRARQIAEADLPHLVLLLAAALRGGAPPATALAVGCAALPGAAADRLEPVRARLDLGVDPAEVWTPLVGDAVLAPLARTMARAARSGARVADAVDRLSLDLALQSRARSEERARSVGVRAALPLGLCLLPAFLLIGIVPVVAGLFTELTR
jgi:Flp pilus assembly protein TadB